MVSPLFGIDIKKLVADNFKGKLNQGTLTVVTHGSRTGGQLTAGRVPTTSTSTFWGIVDDYTDREREFEQVEVGDRKVLIIAGTLTPAVVPKSKDRVTIEGTTYEIVGVPERDPAEATYVLQVRGG